MERSRLFWFIFILNKVKVKVNPNYVYKTKNRNSYRNTNYIRATAMQISVQNSIKSLASAKV